MKRVYKLRDLECANCAAKMEAAVAKLDGVEAVTVNFMTQKLTLEAPDNVFDRVLSEVQSVIKKVEPDCKLIGEDGNIYNLMGLAARTLRKNGLTEQATEMTERITACGSYDEALGIIGEYVNITGEDETEDMDEGMGMRL